MARPIRETPVLKGEDAFNFEMRRLEVENRTPEERAEAKCVHRARRSPTAGLLRALWCICAPMRPTSRSLYVGMPTDDVDVEKEYQLIPIDSL